MEGVRLAKNVLKSKLDKRKREKSVDINRHKETLILYWIFLTEVWSG
jgi:hypothetical protein